MTSCTPIYQLPYVIGSDRPCDVGDTLCAFANGVETQLDLLDAIVNRTVDTVPFAQVRLTNTFSYDNGIGNNVTLAVPFDTVDADTANMVDLTSNPYIITLPLQGRYAASFQVTVANAITSGNTHTFEIDGIGSAFTNSTGATDTYISDGSNPAMFNGASIFRYSTTAPFDTNQPTMALNWSFFTAGVNSVSLARMTIYWLGDA